MALTKQDIIQKIQEHYGWSQCKAMDTFEALLEIIKSELEDGDDVMISGFGKFCVRTKKERRGRNPATGESMMLSSRKTVTFQCSGKLRKAVNQSLKN